MNEHPHAHLVAGKWGGGPTPRLANPGGEDHRLGCPAVPRLPRHGQRASGEQLDVGVESVPRQADGGLCPSGARPDLPEPTAEPVKAIPKARSQVPRPCSNSNSPPSRIPKRTGVPPSPSSLIRLLASNRQRSYGIALASTPATHDRCQHLQPFTSKPETGHVLSRYSDWSRVPRPVPIGTISTGETYVRKLRLL